MKSVTKDFLDLMSGEATLQPIASATPTTGPSSEVSAASRVASLPATPDGPGRPGVAFTPPVPVRQVLPQWRPPNEMAAQRSYSGAVKVTIDADGNVTSAVMVRRIHPFYDREVLQAARGWIYKPATREGHPISSETTVDIKLGTAQEQ